MAFCEACGAEFGSESQFCARCGAQRSDPAPAPAPHVAAPPPPPPTMPFGTAPGQPATTPVAVPEWLRSDWPVVIVCVLLILGVMTAVGVVYGAILGLVAGEGGGDLVAGGLSGAYLVFSMFGATMGAATVADEPLVLVTRFLPLLLLVVPVIAIELALRFALPRVANRPSNLLALIGKTAVVVGALAGILGALLSFGEIDLDLVGNQVNAEFVTKVEAGPAIFYSFFIVLVIGCALLWRRRLLPGVHRLSRWLSPTWAAGIADGALAFLALAAALGVVATLLAVVVADSGAERLLAVLGLPVVGLNLGVAAALVVMGGSVQVDSYYSFEGSGVGHISLFNWGFPPPPDANGAPPYLFVLLLAAPFVVAWFTHRRLERRRPRTEQEVLSVAFSSVLGFAATVFLLSFLGRITLQGEGKRVGGLLALAPSPRSALGFGLLWGLVGALGAAVLWARGHGISWSLASSAGTAGVSGTATGAVSSGSFPGPAPAATTPLPGPPLPAAEDPPGVGGCRRCGAALVPTARFCEACGTAGDPGPT